MFIKYIKIYLKLIWNYIYMIIKKTNKKKKGLK